MGRSGFADEEKGFPSFINAGWVGLYFQLLGMAYIAIGIRMTSENRKEGEKVSSFDIIMTAIINLILAVLYFSWIILVARIQYFLF